MQVVKSEIPNKPSCPFRAPRSMKIAVCYVPYLKPFPSGERGVWGKVFFRITLNLPFTAETQRAQSKLFIDTTPLHTLRCLLVNGQTG